MDKSKKKTKKKQSKKKPRSVRRPARKPARKANSASGGNRVSWLDEAAQTSLIDTYARKLGSFVDALADGVVQESELAVQEKRLVKLMKEVEPRLDDDTHVRVTELLCELTAYDIMHILHAMHAARMPPEFRG